MKTQHRPLARGIHPRAFTLIELLVVMSIIAILAALTMGTFRYAQQTAARNRTTAGISAISGLLEQYKDKFGEYPEPANAAAMSSSNSSLRIGGALMLYQVITADGTNQIKLATGATTTPSDGIIDDNERPNTLSADYIPAKDTSGQWRTSKLNSTLVTSDGFMLVDGFGRPYQYEKAGSTDAVNATFDLWSFAQKDPASISSPYALATKKDDKATAAWIKNW